MVVSSTPYGDADNVAREARQEGHRGGWQKGIAEERENSMRRLVYMCRRLAFDPETAAKEIAEQFDIPLHLAAEKIGRAHV